MMSFSSLDVLSLKVMMRMVMMMMIWRGRGEGGGGGGGISPVNNPSPLCLSASWSQNVPGPLHQRSRIVLSVQRTQLPPGDAWRFLRPAAVDSSERRGAKREPWHENPGAHTRTHAHAVQLRGCFSSWGCSFLLPGDLKLDGLYRVRADNTRRDGWM